MGVVTSWKKMASFSTWFPSIVLNYIAAFERKGMDQSAYLFVMVATGDADLLGRLVLYHLLPPYRLLLALRVKRNFM